MIFVNFKTYEQSTGSSALGLVRELEEAASESEIKVIPVVQAGDVIEVVQSTKLEVWVQHVDAAEFGAHTGAILPEAVFEDGAVGTFLNHSERRYPTPDELAKANARATAVGLKTLIFAGDLQSLEQIALLSPTYLAYEPPELVGSTTVSVSTAHPDVIQQAAHIAKAHGLPLIVGAGIRTADDVRVSLQLGAVGVAVATNVVKAEDPKTALAGLMEAFKG